MSDPETDSPLRTAVADALQERGLIASTAEIKEWSIWPTRDCDVAVRVTSPGRVSRLKDDNALGITKRVERAGHYINIWLDLDELVAAAALASRPVPNVPSVSRRIAVEHTSLTPVYPLNIATFRSTALGSALSRIASSQGERVASYFWVEDEAAQLALVTDAICHLRLGVSSGSTYFPSGKSDHVLGRLLVLARHLRGRIGTDPEALARMFPLAASPDVHALAGMSFEEPFLQSADRRAVALEMATRCVEGFTETFKVAGVEQPQYVLGSEEIRGERLVRAMDSLRDFDRASPEGPRYTTEALAPSYLVRNIAWFSWLAEHADELIIVAPARQRLVVERAAEVLLAQDRSGTAVSPVLFGDVVDVSGELDRPSHGRFTSVDGYLASEGKRLGWREDSVASSLKLHLLSKGPSHRVVLDPGSNATHALAMGVHRALEAGGSRSTSADALRRACKRVADHESVVRLARERLDPSVLVRDLESLARITQSLRDQEVHQITCDALLRLLHLLDIRWEDSMGTV